LEGWLEQLHQVFIAIELAQVPQKDQRDGPRNLRQAYLATIYRLQGKVRRRLTNPRESKVHCHTEPHSYY
jgi:hypothetical protein